MSSSALIGIFVGGASRRMGEDKGLLAEPDGPRTLVERLRDEALRADPTSSIVIVGERKAYAPLTAKLGLGVIADAKPRGGPLSGLVALLQASRAQGFETAVALACDLPHVNAALLTRLLTECPNASVFAARQGEGGRSFWQPLCARYRVEAALPLAKRRLETGLLALQPLLDELGADELTLGDEERGLLVDWDTPADRRSRD